MSAAPKDTSDEAKTESHEKVEDPNQTLTPQIPCTPSPPSSDDGHPHDDVNSLNPEAHEYIPMLTVDTSREIMDNSIEATTSKPLERYDHRKVLLNMVRLFLHSSATPHRNLYRTRSFQGPLKKKHSFLFRKF